MSMGFLTESALQLKAAKPIAVDTSSIVDLKAALFQRESEVRHSVSLSVSADGASARFKAAKRPHGSSAAGGGALSSRDAKGLAGANRGVAERNARDQAVSAAESRAGSEALTKKSKMYEAMTRGAVSDEATKGNFLVDFQAKGWMLADEEAERKRTALTAAAANANAGDSDSDANANAAGAALESDDTDRRSRSQRAIDAAAEAAAASGTHTLDSGMFAAARERAEWERKAMSEITGERAIRGSGSASDAIRQNYEKSLSSEEKELLAEVEAATRAGRDKRRHIKRARDADFDKRKALLDAKNQRKRVRAAQLASAAAAAAIATHSTAAAPNGTATASVAAAAAPTSTIKR